MVGAGESFSFSPQTVNINVGDTVAWQWVSTSIPHTVTSGTPGAADGVFCSVPAGTTMNVANCNSVSYAKTAPNSFSQTFATAGTFAYFCEVHGAMMTGTVVVGSGTSSGGGGGTGGTGGGGY
jgi:plastocyanin